MLTAALWLTAAAHAAAGDYTGEYDLSCTALHLSVNTNLTYNDVFGGTAWPQGWDLDLPCSVRPRVLERWARSVALQCTQAGLPRAVCRDFGINLYQSVRPYADTAAHVAPDRVELEVNTWSSPLALFGVYDTTFLLHYAHAADMLAYGSVQTAPADEGYVWLPSLSLEGAAAGQAVCLGGAGGLFEGHIQPGSFAFAGGYDVTAGLACAATTTDTAQLWTASIDMTASVDLTGVRLP